MRSCEFCFYPLNIHFKKILFRSVKHNYYKKHFSLFSDTKTVTGTNEESEADETGLRGHHRAQETVTGTDETSGGREIARGIEAGRGQDPIRQRERPEEGIGRRNEIGTGLATRHRTGLLHLNWYSQSHERLLILQGEVSLNSTIVCFAGLKSSKQINRFVILSKATGFNRSSSR